jgi:hypothetical protein
MIIGHLRESRLYEGVVSNNAEDVSLETYIEVYNILQDRFKFSPA